MNSLFTPNLDVDNLPLDDMYIERHLNRLDVKWGSHLAIFNDEKNFMSFLYNISRSVHINVYIQDMNQKIDFEVVKHTLTYATEEITETNSPKLEGNPRRKLGKSDKDRIRNARKRRKDRKKAERKGIEA
jgi:hypothetical protein